MTTIAPQKIDHSPKRLTAQQIELVLRAESRRSRLRSEVLGRFGVEPIQVR